MPDTRDAMPATRPPPAMLPRRSGYLPIVLTLGIGVALSVLAAQTVRTSERQRVQAIFSESAHERINMIRLGVHDCLSTLEAVGGLFAASQAVERAEFCDYVHPLLEKQATIMQAFAWVPRVRDADRPVFKAGVRAEGFARFELLEHAAGGGWNQAASRDEYFPVCYAEPCGHPPLALGFDLGTDATLRAGLDRACATGALTAITSSVSDTDAGAPAEVWALLPVYQRGVLTTTPDERRANLQGFVVGVFSVGAVVEQSLAYLHPAGVDVVLLTANRAPDAPPLYVHVSRTRAAEASVGADPDTLARAPMRETGAFEVGGQTWRLTGVPAPQFLAQARTKLAWGALAAGLALTGFAVSYLVANARRAAEQEEANHRLSREVAERRRMEEAEHNHARFLQILLDTIPNAIFYKDLAGRYQGCNATFAEWVGRPQEDIIGRTVREVCSDEVADQHAAVDRELHARSDTRVYDSWLPLPDGERREIILHKAPYTDAEGRIAGVLASCTDITERKRAAAALAESEARHRAITSCARDAIITTDAHGRILFWNAAAEHIFGYCADDVLGHDVIECIVPPRDRTARRGALARFALGDGPEARGRTLEITALRRDGTEFPIEIAVSAYTDRQNFVGVAVARDITARKQAAEELSNRAMALQAANRELDAANCRLEAAIEHAEAMAEAAEAASVAKSEFLANMSHELHTPLTAITGFTDLLHDELTSESHCLIESECNLRARCREHLDTIRRNSRYLLSIINDILDLSKLDAGQLEANRVACALFDFLESLQALMGARARDHGLDFKVEFAGAVPDTLHTDGLRLRQILIHVISNAIKFTPRGGVRLICRLLNAGADEAQLQFDVVDTGIGMTPEQAACIFQPFTQADASATRQFGGTGLGLSVSRRLAQLLGGDVQLIESAPGRGSCFRVTIATGPLGGVRLVEVPGPPRPDRAPAEPSAAPAAAPAPLSIDILLAEDCADNQRLISFVLTQAGARVQLAGNGQIALQEALAARDRGQPFDVILMDMQMPVMDGYEATRQLRRAGYTGPIVALTAHTLEGDRAKCLQAGCTDFAGKPIHRGALLTLLQRYARAATAGSV
jgi:PAS domain S-box-containing protein